MLMYLLISLLFVKSPLLANGFNLKMNSSGNSSNFSNEPGKEDAILGKWMTTENNLEVQVYKKNNHFQAKIIWFKMDDTSKSINSILDEKNPNPDLRKRKWLGMEVLNNLQYNKKDNEWEGGIVYDAKHGREWDSVVWIDSQGLLKVKGYWVFRWISQTLTFKKVL